MHPIHSSITALVLLAASSCFAAQGPAPEFQVTQPLADTAAPASPTAILTGVKAHQEALQQRNAALMTRSQVCTKRVREGSIKPTASAQFACLMGAEPK